MVPVITINKVISLIDEPLIIKFSNLEPQQQYEVNLSRRSVTKQDIKYRKSNAIFQSNSFGEINLSVQKPLSGTYSVVDPMGLFWSMEVVKKEKNWNEKYVKLAPHQFEISIKRNNQTIGVRKFTKTWFDSEVKKIHVRDNVIGTYFYKEDQKVKPTLIILGGSEGGTFEFPSGLLASHGFNVLAVGFFGMEGLHTNLINIPLETIQYAINWLKNRNEVDKQWIGIHGTSRGGELALWSAVLFDDIKAAVSLNGSGISFSGIISWSDETILQPAWTYQNKPLPYTSPNNPVEAARRCKQMFDKGENPLPLWYDALFRDQEFVKDSIIPINNTDKDVLLISGEDDLQINSVKYNEFSKGEHIKHIIYSNAGHEIGFPNIPILANQFFGGTKKDTFNASKESWEKTIEFLKESYFSQVSK